MIGIEYGQRLEELHYERFGLSKTWDLYETALMLTCFDIETKGYSKNDDSSRYYESVFSKYHDYLSECIWSGKLACYCEYEVKHPRHIDPDRTSFEKSEFLEFISTKSELKIDVVELKRCLLKGCLPTLKVTDCGSKIPEVATIGSKVPCNHESVNSERLEEARSELPNDNTTHIVFEKVGSGWNIQYDNASLKAVKDWRGMSYIKILLTQPGEPIDVLTLQRLAGEDVDLILSTDYEDQCDNDYSTKSEIKGAWERCDDAARANYRQQLEKIKVQIDDARIQSNQELIDRLLKEAEWIGRELKGSEGREKDPVLETNRKRVSKALDDAIAKIGKLEAMCNYNGKPISSHLKRSIRKGVCCSYSPDKR